MDELVRQQYINALGIDGYMPRVLLNHAPAPVLCPEPALPQAAIAEHITPEVSGKAQPSTSAPAAIESVTASVGQVLQDMGVKTQPKKSPAPAPVRKAHLGVEPLHIHLWRPTPQLLVIDEHEPGSALPKELLLTNILRITQRIAQPIGAAERVRCPITDELARMYSEEDLREELQAWLNEELVKAPPETVWIFGLRPAQYFTTSQNEACTAFCRTTIKGHGEASGEHAAIVFPSLTELLQQPDLKRQIWRTLHSQVADTQ